MKRGTRIRCHWVFDFDGTLSPLVPDRTAARLHPASLARGIRGLQGIPGSVRAKTRRIEAAG